MALPPGTYTLGPENGTLAVRTGRTGAAAKAGHNLLLHVMSWQATLAVADDVAASSVELTADGGSLRVIEGTGGVQALGDDDKAEIQKTIDDDVLKREPITFRSTSVADADGGLRVEGALTLRRYDGADRVRPRARRRAREGRRHRHADGVEDQAVLDPVRRAQGRRRGRGRARRDCRRRAASARAPVAKTVQMRQSRYTVCASSPPSTPGGSCARAVRVQREVGDRPRLVRVGAVAGHPRAVRPRETLGRRAERHPGQQPRLVLDLVRDARDRRRRPFDGAVLNPCPVPNRSVSAGTTFTSSGGTPSSSRDDLGGLRLVAVGLGGQAQHHLPGRVDAQEHRPVCLVGHYARSSCSEV